MTPSEILIAAKGLIDAPEKWTQNEQSRDKNGRFTNLHGPDAVQFSADGAIYKIAPLHKDYQKPEAILQSVIDDWLSRWNNSPKRLHAEVMAAFDKAIKAAQEAGE